MNPESNWGPKARAGRNKQKRGDIDDDDDNDDNDDTIKKKK